MRAKVGIGRTKDGKVVAVVNHMSGACGVGETREEALRQLVAEMENCLLRGDIWGRDLIFLNPEEVELPGTGRSPAAAFGQGDVVQLSCGGPRMTVEKIEGERVHCLRLSDRGEVLRSDFAAGLLEVVRKAD